MAKYQDAKRRTLQAFSDLKMKNLEIKEGGLAINSDAARQTRFMMQNGMQTQKVKTPIEVSAPLHLRLSGVQNMTPTEMVEVVGQLLDLAKDCARCHRLTPTKWSIGRTAKRTCAAPWPALC